MNFLVTLCIGVATNLIVYAAKHVGKSVNRSHVIDPTNKTKPPVDIGSMVDDLDDAVKRLRDRQRKNS